MGVLVAYLLGILTAIKHEHHDRDSDYNSSRPPKDQPFPNGHLNVTCIPPSPSKEEAAEKKKSKRRKAITFWVQIGSLVVLLVYAGFTILIWCAMRRANELTRKQLEATTAAFLRIEVLHSLQKEEANFGLSLANPGHAVARNVSVEFIVTIRSLPDERVIKSVSPPWSLTIPEMEASPSPVPGELYAFNLSSQEVQALKNTEETVRLEGKITYDNGFGKQVRSICTSALLGEFKDGGNVDTLYNCSEFKSRLALFLAEKSERDRKH
jgi:hypothetical protein